MTMANQRMLPKLRTVTAPNRTRSARESRVASREIRHNAGASCFAGQTAGGRLVPTARTTGRAASRGAVKVCKKAGVAAEVIVIVEFIIKYDELNPAVRGKFQKNESADWRRIPTDGRAEAGRPTARLQKAAIPRPDGEGR